MSETRVAVKSTHNAHDFAAAWSTSYAQYLTRATSRPTRTLELFHQVLACVSRGRLSAATLADCHRRFVQARGSDYANDLAELSARFFNGLVQVSGGSSQAIAELVSPDLPGPDLPAPHIDPAHPTEWFEQLAEYAGRFNTAAVKAYQSHLEQVAKAGATTSQVQRATAASPDGRLPEHVGRILSLYFGLLNGISNISNRYEEEYLLGVLAGANGSGSAMTVGLHLAGQVGETTSASLAFENTREDRTVIRCALSDVRRADGVDPAFPSRIAIAPAHIELGPGEETHVHLSLGLDAAVYEPDALYIGTLYILRDGHPRLEVPIRITATDRSSTEGSR